MPAFVALVESLRKDIRGVATGTVYAVTVAVFGGTTQPLVAWLDHVTGNPLAIAWYLMAGTAVGLVAALAMPETVNGWGASALGRREATRPNQASDQGFGAVAGGARGGALGSA